MRASLYTHEIPALFKRFSQVFEERYWLRRVDSINAMIRGYPHLKDHLIEENRLAYFLAGLTAMSMQSGGIPITNEIDHDIYNVVSFIAQALSLWDSAQGAHKERLVRRIQGAFSNPDELDAINLEFTAATHFTQRGYQVKWTEMDDSDSDTYDLLVEGIGQDGMEVECKAISKDKGRMIHTVDAKNFMALAQPAIQELIKGMTGGSIIRLTIPDRLPKEGSAKEVLIEWVRQAIRAGKSLEFEGCSVSIEPYDSVLTAHLRKGVDQREARDVIDGIVGTENKEVMFQANGSNASVIFVLSSAKEEKLVAYIFDTLKRSAKRQPSQTRPMVYMVALLGLQPGELESIAAQDADPSSAPSPLQLGVSKFLDSSGRDHVAAVCFMGAGQMSAGNGTYRGGGASYCFPKRESKFWHPDMDKLFN